MAFLLILLEIYCYCEPILYFFRISPSPEMAFLAVHPAFWSVVFEIAKLFFALLLTKLRTGSRY